MMNRGILGIFLLGLGAVVNAQQLDPVINFCRRSGHQSVVKNEVLYIDGGEVTYIDVNDNGEQTGNITRGVNQYLITVDMSTTWDWKTNITINAHTKANDTTINRAPPSLAFGALYQGPLNDTKLYSYGGSVNYENTSRPGWEPAQSAQYPLWSYNSIGSEWTAIDLSDDGVIRATAGADAEAPDQGLGFWYNGAVDSGTSTQARSLGSTIKFLQGMIVIDFHTGRAKNISTTAVSDQARVRGKMAYIPGIGERGVLVLIGGGEKGTGYENFDWHGTLVSMATIYVFDVASLYDPSTPDGAWYQQRATGDVPESRLDHCIVAVSAPDGSSHNIYMYGGRDASGTIFDDIYVLSLPSFTWIRIYTGDAPRFGMTCHLVGNRQMITVGGNEQTSITSNCDWERKSVAIYDLATVQWGSVFVHNAPAYEVPKLIRDVIGGQPSGNASLIEPNGGFTDSNLAVLFFPNSTSPNTTATNVPFASATSSDTSKDTSTDATSTSNTGAIAGGVVGGIAALALIGGFLFFRKRRRNQYNPAYIAEAGGTAFIEKDGAVVKTNNELPGDGEFPEGTTIPVEMPGGISTHQPQELSSANYIQEANRNSIAR